MNSSWVVVNFFALRGRRVERSVPRVARPSEQGRFTQWLQAAAPLGRERGSCQWQQREENAGCQSPKVGIEDGCVCMKKARPGLVAPWD